MVGGKWDDPCCSPPDEALEQFRYIPEHQWYGYTGGWFHLSGLGLGMGRTGWDRPVRTGNKPPGDRPVWNLNRGDGV